MKVVVDTSACTALGICESFAPDVFEIDDDGELVVKAAEISDDVLAAVKSAVAGCPTAALRLEAK